MKFSKKVLKNGLRVVTVPMKDNPAVTVLVMVEAGSKYETKDINGISHFLEHMVFKGTTKRPQATLISKELDSLGAQSNAFTSNEYTGYYAKVAAKHLDKALEIISDMYLDPIFDEKEIEKEKGVIIEEIRMYKDLPQRQIQDELDELLHGDQPAGWNVIGTEDNIRSFGRKHFVEYRKKHYVASATTVVVSGPVTEKEVIKKVEKNFSKIPATKKEGKVAVKEAQKKPEVRVVHKDTGQTHLAMGIRTFSIFDKRVPVLKVLAGVLGNGMSSRLFSKMRDQLGICYYIHASYDGYTDHGHLNVSAGVDTTRVDEGIKTILSELNRMKSELVSPEELKKAKDFIAGMTLLNLETSDDQAAYVGNQEILKKEIQTPEERIAAMQKVTAEQVRDLAKEIFADKNLNMAIIGPYKDPKRFEKILTFKK